jgi:hypothetical protein
MLRCRSGAETAGRPTTRAALKDISGATYIERQAIDLMADLAPDEALDARQHPIVGNDRVHDVAIFPIMLAVGGGYPLRRPTRRSANLGRRRWSRDDHRRTRARRPASVRTELDTLYEDRWTQLTDRQRQYLIAVINTLDADGVTTSTRRR